MLNWSFGIIDFHYTLKRGDRKILVRLKLFRVILLFHFILKYEKREDLSILEVISILTPVQRKAGILITLKISFLSNLPNVVQTRAKFPEQAQKINE